MGDAMNAERECPKCHGGPVRRSVTTYDSQVLAIRRRLHDGPAPPPKVTDTYWCRACRHEWDERRATNVLAN
jgi:hypothetical protein